MKCDLCRGEYREKLVTRSYTFKGRTVVVEGVPALVCDQCGDILIREETVAAIDDLLERGQGPQGYAPVYRFPARVA
jgi:YgiT-type zinc finger domain-containing protein